MPTYVRIIRNDRIQKHDQSLSLAHRRPHEETFSLSLSALLCASNCCICVFITRVHLNFRSLIRFQIRIEQDQYTYACVCECASWIIFLHFVHSVSHFLRWFRTHCPQNPVKMLRIHDVCRPFLTQMLFHSNAIAVALYLSICVLPLPHTRMYECVHISICLYVCVRPPRSIVLTGCLSMWCALVAMLMQ